MEISNGFWTVLATIVFAGTFTTSSLSGEFERQTKITEWLNTQLAESGYQSIISGSQCEERVENEIETAACTYRYADGAYLMLAADQDGLISTQQLITYTESNGHNIEQESMYIFSLLIWGTMDNNVGYEEANKVLSNLYELSFRMAIAQVKTSDWTFAISETEFCENPILIFSSQRIRTGFSASDLVNSIPTELCRLLPN